MLTAKALEYLKLGTGGSYSLARDAIAHRLWDTRSFASTAQSYTYFSQPIASPWLAGSSKSLNETNMNNTASLPNGQTFLCNRIAVAVISPAQFQCGIQSPVDQIISQAAKTILENSVFEIILAGRSFDFQAHGRQFLSMPLSAIGQLTATGANFAGDYSRLGDYIASGWIKLDPTPIFIDQLVSFQVNQRLDNPVPALKVTLDAASYAMSSYNATMMVILDGFLTRAK